MCVLFHLYDSLDKSSEHQGQGRKDDEKLSREMNRFRQVEQIVCQSSHCRYEYIVYLCNNKHCQRTLFRIQQRMACWHNTRWHRPNADGNWYTLPWCREEQASTVWKPVIRYHTKALINIYFAPETSSQLISTRLVSALTFNHNYIYSYSDSRKFIFLCILLTVQFRLYKVFQTVQVCCEFLARRFSFE